MSETAELGRSVCRQEFEAEAPLLTRIDRWLENVRPDSHSKLW